MSQTTTMSAASVQRTSGAKPPVQMSQMRHADGRKGADRREDGDRSLEIARGGRGGAAPERIGQERRHRVPPGPERRPGVAAGAERRRRRGTAVMSSPD